MLRRRNNACLSAITSPSPPGTSTQTERDENVLNPPSGSECIGEPLRGKAARGTTGGSSPLKRTVRRVLSLLTVLMTGALFSILFRLLNKVKMHRIAEQSPSSGPGIGLASGLHDGTLALCMVHACSLRRRDWRIFRATSPPRNNVSKYR